MLIYFACSLPLSQCNDQASIMEAFFYLNARHLSRYSMSRSDWQPAQAGSVSHSAKLRHLVVLACGMYTFSMLNVPLPRYLRVSAQYPLDFFGLRDEWHPYRKSKPIFTLSCTATSSTGGTFLPFVKSLLYNAAKRCQLLHIQFYKLKRQLNLYPVLCGAHLFFSLVNINLSIRSAYRFFCFVDTSRYPKLKHIV